MTPPARPLLDHRLIIVTGKGGTGKTTVAAALALAAQRAGRRVLVAETAAAENVPRLLDPTCSEVGYAGREFAPGLFVMRIDPYAALAEYIGLQLGAQRLAQRVLAFHPFHQLMDATPGWRELITLGKIWHLEQKRRSDGRHQFDLLVVDAPATGHSLTFLDVPRVARSAVRSGPLRRHAGWVEALIHDPERTLLLPVALAEELPARETIELVTRLRDQLAVHVDRVVVNSVTPQPFPENIPDLDEQLAALPDDTPLGTLPPVSVLAACASHLHARFQLNRRYSESIARDTHLPLVPLPQLATGVCGPKDLEVLGAALLRTPEVLAA